MRTAIGLGGDTDTLAAIAGAVAEAIHGDPPEVAARARAHLTADLVATLDAFDAVRLRSGRCPPASRPEAGGPPR